MRQPPEINLETSTAFVEAFYSAVQLVVEYMRKSNDMILGVLSKDDDTKIRDHALQGLWLRAFAWMQSLETLNHTKHFQAIASGNRALLEITVDLILLHCDKSNESPSKLHWWAQSEKLKAATSIVGFFTKANVAIPDEFKAQEIFYNNQKAGIEMVRKQLWGIDDHPRRWTGNRDLSRDVEDADRLLGTAITEDLGMSLLEYYRTEYRRMNWQIHSGVAAFGNIRPEGFNLMCAMSLKWSADLAMLCTKIALIDFGFATALSGLNKEWDELKKKRLLAYGLKMYASEQN
jgi:hypothetical protein